jgi:hypothetical protein
VNGPPQRCSGLFTCSTPHCSSPPYFENRKLSWAATPHPRCPCLLTRGLNRRGRRSSLGREEGQLALARPACHPFGQWGQRGKAAVVLDFIHLVRWKPFWEVGAGGGKPRTRGKYAALVEPLDAGNDRDCASKYSRDEASRAFVPYPHSLSLGTMGQAFPGHLLRREPDRR